MNSLRVWRNAWPVAFEGTGFAVPFSVSAITLLYAKISPDLMVPGMLAALLGMVLMQLVNAGQSRPLVYSARVLEISMLIGFLDQFILKMSGWGLTDTPAHRLMLVMAVSVGAALLLPLLFVMRLQRFVRMIPTPVFAGFNTALALTILISQSAVLWNSRLSDGSWFACVALLVMLVAIASQRFTARMPHGVVGLTVGMLAVFLLSTGGLHAFRTVMDDQLSLSLPVFLLPWRDGWSTGVDLIAIARDVLLASVTLTVLVFLNTVVNSEAVTQLDEREARPNDWYKTTAAGVVVTLFGSPVLTPSLAATRCAVKVGPLNSQANYLIAALMLLVLGSGLLRVVPLAAICGLLLFDAWTSFDRPSFRAVMQWLRGHTPTVTAKEDLATIALVAVGTVAFNIVIGVAIGIFAGLVLYAWRNGRKLARTVATGAAVRSNCSRSRADVALLSEHSQRVGFVALEGALFFGVASAIQSLLRAQCRPGRFVVVDWSHVVSADSTVAGTFARAVAEAHKNGAYVAVSGLAAAGPQVSDALATSDIQVAVFADADRALEWVENELIQSATSSLSFEATTLQDGVTLLRGLTHDQRETLEKLFEQRFFRAGEKVFTAGQQESELMIVLQGSVDILVPRGHLPGADMRVARLRRGAMLGEMSFLDTSARAATAVATEDLLVAILSRKSFDAFANQSPHAGVQVLTNLSLDLAMRLRRTNNMAVNSLR